MFSSPPGFVGRAFVYTKAVLQSAASAVPGPAAPDTGQTFGKTCTHGCERTASVIGPRKGRVSPMHLAICDDNIADRKQMERLLGRESDRRLPTTGVFYVDSYGNKDAILSAPMIYDGIFIDMSQNKQEAVEIASRLRANTENLSVVFCCSGSDYRNLPGLPEGSLFLDKPIQAGELTRICDELLSRLGSREDKLEYRTVTETLYLEESQILHAIPKEKSVLLHLQDGRAYQIGGDMTGFCASTRLLPSSGKPAKSSGHIRLSSSGLLAMIGDRAVINLKSVTKVGPFHLTMSDGTKVRIPFYTRGPLQEAAERARRFL